MAVDPKPTRRSNHGCGEGATVAAETARDDEGLSHHGEPDPEVIVLEEASRLDTGEPNLVRAPRAPSQKEIDEHAATHLPHAEWCDFCMKGRGRNSPHKKRRESGGGADTGRGPTVVTQRRKYTRDPFPK